MSEQARTITVEGVEHDLSIFPIEVQRLVSIHQTWESKMIDKRLDLAMIEAALRDLTRELTVKIKETLDAQATEAVSEAPAAE